MSEAYDVAKAFPILLAEIRTRENSGLPEQYAEAAQICQTGQLLAFGVSDVWEQQFRIIGGYLARRLLRYRDDHSISDWYRRYMNALIDRVQPLPPNSEEAAITMTTRDTSRD